MAQQVVTELVIDADTSGADRFEGSMKSAMGSAQTAVLAIAGVSAASIAAIAGLKAFYDWVGNSNKSLVDLADQARSANMSTQEFQKTLFAARASGVSDKDFIAGIDKMGDNILNATRGVTTFGKFLELNNISLRQANGELITQEQLMSKISVLMSRSSPEVQRAIAGIVGVSKEWIPFLAQGNEEIERLKKSSAELGIIISDDVIKASKEFDKEWKTAIAAWDLQFKASIASIMPLLVQLANLAKLIIDGIGAVAGKLGQWTTPDAEKSGAQLKRQIDDVERLIKLQTEFEATGGGMRGLAIGDSLMPDTLQMKTQTLKGSLGLPEDADLARIKQYREELEKMGQTRDRILVTPDRSGKGGAKLPGFGDDENAINKALDSINKHTLMTEANTKAVGLGAGALAQYRAEAQLAAAEQASGVKATKEQKERFLELATAAYAAADALAKAKVANDIRFGRQTMFLSQEDVAIANQLRHIYPDVATALSSVEAQGLRVNAAFRSMTNVVENQLATGLTDILMGTKSVSQGFRDMSLAVIRALEEMLIKMLILQPIMKSMQTMFNSFMGGGIPVAGDPNFIGPVLGSANGNAFSGGNVIPFANGGILGGPTLAPMALMGEAGPEAVMPLRRGADGKLGVASSGGGAGSITFGDINISVPEGTSAENAKDVASQVKGMLGPLVDERLRYHTQRRGMLNP